MLKHFVLSVLLISFASAQEWKQITAENSGLPSNLVYALTIAPDGTVWAGTGNGLAALNGKTWTVYDTSNSPLPDPYITALAVDSAGSIWIGTGFAGVARLAHNVWTVYDSSNSDLPDNTIYDITVGPDGTPWFATNDGVVNFKEGLWKNLRSNMVEPRSRSLIFDQQGVLWMGTYDPTDFRGYIEYMKGDTFSHTILAKHDLISTHAFCMLPAKDSSMFVGTGNGLVRVVNGVWTIYHSQDSPLPANGVQALAAVGDTMIIGTASGAAEYVHGSWNVIHPSPGTLPNDVVTTIAVDRNGNRWFATGNSGISVYKKGGIISHTGNRSLEPAALLLYQNYPNPFNPTTAISYQLPVNGVATVIVYDALGREVAIVVNERKDAGTYTVAFNASHLATGMYIVRLTSGGYTQTKRMMLIK